MLLALGVSALFGTETLKATTVEPKRVERLVERIDQHQHLFQEHNDADAYEMQGSEWRKGAKDKKEEIRFNQRMGKGIKLLLKEFAEEEDHFWIFENNDWYYIPLKLRDWDDSKAVEVPVPAQPMKINIKEKD